MIAVVLEEVVRLLKYGSYREAEKMAEHALQLTLQREGADNIQRVFDEMKRTKALFLKSREENGFYYLDFGFELKGVDKGVYKIFTFGKKEWEKTYDALNVLLNTMDDGRRVYDGVKGYCVVCDMKPNYMLEAKPLFARGNNEN